MHSEASTMRDLQNALAGLRNAKTSSNHGESRGATKARYKLARFLREKGIHVRRSRGGPTDQEFLDAIHEYAQTCVAEDREAREWCPTCGASIYE
jgi:hypothetical protein